MPESKSQTLDDVKFITAYNDLGKYPNQHLIGEAFGISDRMVRNHATRIRKDRPGAFIDRNGVLRMSAPTNGSAGRFTPLGADEIHALTCAQNNTAASPAFKTLLRYCKDRGAKLHVIPLSYKTSTPNSENDSRDSDERWWATAFMPCLMEPGSTLDIAGGHGVIMANQIHATAVNPVQGYESIGGEKWVFLGHPQIQMRVTATAKHKLPNLVHTSGSMTVNNYREGTAGLFLKLSRRSKLMRFWYDDPSIWYYLEGQTIPNMQL